MAAVAQRRIQAHLARLGRQYGQNLIHANRPVHASRGLPARHHPVNSPGVAERVKLLVFLGKAARVRAGVAHAALVGSCFIRHRRIVLYATPKGA